MVVIKTHRNVAVHLNALIVALSSVCEICCCYYAFNFIPVLSLDFCLVSQCGGTTHVLRLSWSPDGQYLVSAHAMNNSGPTAQIVERDGWKTNMDFVGHRKAVTVVVRNFQTHAHP